MVKQFPVTKYLVSPEWQVRRSRNPFESSLKTDSSATDSEHGINLPAGVCFFLFFLSGYSSLIYPGGLDANGICDRFGIITPVLSVVLSVFMLGLAVGSWAGGRWIAVLERKSGLSAAFFYAGAELLIGLGAFAVPEIIFDGRTPLAPQAARRIRSAIFFVFGAGAGSLYFTMVRMQWARHSRL